MSSQSALFETLQREFCPPLDSSLLAALLADLESDEEGHPVYPSSNQISDLRATLHELSAQADVCQLSEFSELQMTFPNDDTSSTPDFYHGNTATSSSLGSDSSDSSQHSFSSPLGFLQAALPHIATSTLSAALQNTDGEDIDMWDVVAGILTEESIRDLQERGLDALDDHDHTFEDDFNWQTVEYKKTVREPPTRKITKKKNRGTTFTLADVRQQQNTRPTNPDHPRSTPAPDPWTQLFSLSSHLATLLPPHPTSLFQSYFHSPDHPTPYDALCACLASICKGQETDSTGYIQTLFLLLDILLPEYEALNREQRSRLISDTELSLKATKGLGEEALDLVKLLRDLDQDSTSGHLEMGVYHHSPPPPAKEAKPKSNLPTEPPVVQPPPQLRPREKPPPRTSNKPSPFQWQAVPQRKVSNYGPHPLARHIPTYTRDVNGKKVRGSGNAFGQGGKGDVGELGEYRRKIKENMRRRNELLREATRMWQRGNSKTRGGEVAFYFAERAREFQKLAMAEAVDAARAMVKSKRLASGDQATVDLHGTTAAEAVIIVREILNEQGSSSNKPLKIITGRGSHSVNQVSVLKPAVKKALVEDGWIVAAWDAGLVVRGKRAGQN